MASKTKVVWLTDKRKVKDLKNWNLNPRKISKEKFNSLKEKIVARGFHDVIVIDTDNTILSGNQRKKALLELGITEVTVLYPSRPLVEEERNKIALESNNHDGEWDFSKLKSFDMELINDIGFSDIDLAKIWQDDLDVKDDDFDVEAEIKKMRKPTTKLGDLILMGKHRLVCGSSNDPLVLKKLFGNDKASAIYSDPIYNLSINYNGGISGKQNYGGDVNDTRSFSEYKEFIRSNIQNALAFTKKDAHCFYWCDQTYIGMFQELYRELGLENKRVCLWLKNSQNPVPSVAFNKCYEPCVYSVRGRPYITKSINNLNEVMNKEITTGNSLLEETLDHLDVWLVKRLSGKDYEHATSKPPSLHYKAIRRCTKPGDIILDSFSGSASTMIAAEQLNRRVFAVELEPAFCDLAMKRYERLTGKKAKVIRNGHEEK